MNFTESCYDINFEREDNDTDIGALITDLSKVTATWGQGNPEALIKVTLHDIPRSAIRVMGKNLDTVKIEKGGISYMFFKCADRIDEFQKYDKMTITLVGKANMNEWMGRFTPQLMVSDFEVTNSILDF